MSVIDPAIRSSPLPDDDDSDWEYEYHDRETEVGKISSREHPVRLLAIKPINPSFQIFYLNLDLTTHHGPIRPPRRRNDFPASTAATAAPTSRPTSTPSRTDDQDPTMMSSETDSPSTERVQILGLHTPNPIISYQNQIFSGSWADQIGTELFFSRPGMSAELDEPASAPAQVAPLKRTKDFDLIAANSVKILGRKANLISSSGSGPAAENRGQQQQQQQQQDPSSSTPTSSSQLPWLVYKPEHQTNQARFLERLMDVKKRRGETDIVRTTFSSSKTAPNLERRLRGWLQTDEQLAAIQQLNDRALQGDPDATRELEDIYAQLASQDAGPSEGPSR